MNEITQAEFARQNGWSRSQVSNLKKKGKIVMSENGKRVMVKETFALLNLEATRPDVKERHDEARNESKTAANGEKNLDDEIKGTAITGASSRLNVSLANAKARLHKVVAEAKMKEIELKKIKSELYEKASVDRGVSVVLSTLTGALENYRSRACQEFAAEPDSDRIYALMGEYQERMLADVCQNLKHLADNG